MESRDERLRHAKALVQAIEDGDLQAEREAAVVIGRQQFSTLHGELHRIAGELRGALCDVHVAGELARIAHKELPDAQLRLNHVLGLTEDAAHRTLTAVEASFPLAEGMATAVAAFRASGLSRVADDQLRCDLGAMLDHIGGDITKLKRCLSEVMMAQSFQDITGQIIRRVVDLAADLECILANGGDDSAELADAPKTVGANGSNKGHGPAVPGKGSEGTVDGQQAVDDLLLELGI